MEFRVKNGKRNKKNASRFAACAAAVMMIGAGTIAGDSWRTVGTAYAAAAQETSAGAAAARRCGNLFRPPAARTYLLRDRTGPPPCNLCPTAARPATVAHRSTMRFPSGSGGYGWHGPV